MKKNNSISLTVSKIIDSVRRRGDAALFGYEKRFNKISLTRRNVKNSGKDFKKAFDGLDAVAKKHLKKISGRISEFQRKIAASCGGGVFRKGGLRITHRFVPVASAAVYVPGGRFYYPSSVLMNALPARTAGVGKIYAASTGISREVLACCFLAGVDSLYRISGAQAIAAFAFGTESVPKADFIAGPGNAYVTEAKRQLYGKIGLDMLAGPSEIAVVADDSVKREWVLADIAAQLEHSPDAKACLITPSRKLYNFIKGIFGKRVPVFLIKSRAGMMAKAEELACEHLLVMTSDHRSWAGKIKRSGAVFLGKYSPVVMGDYAAGPSHTLPTSGGGAFSSGLSAVSFMRSFAEVSYGRKSFLSDSPSAEFMAGAEGMANHGKSLLIRKEKS